jgi:hypothetical protein
VYGWPEVTIPYAELEGVIAPEGPLAPLLN